MLKWKYVSYCQKGLSHEKAGTKCQDSVIVHEDEHCIVAALADGLGSLQHSEVAASTATSTVCKLFAAVGSNKIALNSGEEKQALAKSILQKIAHKIENEGARMNTPLTTMDCTLVFVYVSKDHDYAVTGRLGDSAICVIAKDHSVAITDGNHSANGTKAVLDKDACEHMEVSLWDLTADNIYGFILTSDGLDNELYCKGSPYVTKAVEDYFNAIALAPDPQERIQQKIKALTADEDSSFDDDISIAVISCAATAVSLPADPTWLCSCGARNRLQDTYCCHCGKDFSILYRNIRLKEHGGKAAFFLKINRLPDEEAAIIGLKPKATELNAAVTKDDKLVAANSEAVTEAFMHLAKSDSTDPAGVTAPDAKKEVTEMRKKEHTAKHRGLHIAIHLLTIASVLCLAAAFIWSNASARAGMSAEVQVLSEKIDLLSDLVLELSAARTNAPDTLTPENTETEATPSYPVVIPPKGILLEDDRVFYWGETKDDLPHGHGVSLKNEYYYLGTFVDGKKVGNFAIIPAGDPTQNIQVVYSDDVIDTSASSFEQYIVSQPSLVVYRFAAVDSGIACELESGDGVFRTDTPLLPEDDTEWVEIITGDGTIGWVTADAITAEAH